MSYHNIKATVLYYSQLYSDNVPYEREKKLCGGDSFKSHTYAHMNRVILKSFDVRYVHVHSYKSRSNEIDGNINASIENGNVMFML